MNIHESFNVLYQTYITLLKGFYIPELELARNRIRADFVTESISLHWSFERWNQMKQYQRKTSSDRYQTVQVDFFPSSTA